MKNTFFLGLFCLLCMPNLFAQNVCPDNLIPNGDLSNGTPSSATQDIDNAVGFSGIWSTGSLGEFYAANQSPLNYPTPSPQTGNYASCWISNSNSSSAVYREGFDFEIGNPILSQSGDFNLTFDMACLSGWGNAEVAVYGVFNPTGAASASPTTSHTPSNLNLYGPANTVLLGTVLLNTACSNVKSNHQIRINTGATGFPTNGITHIFITHSDNIISGARYTAFDNFCMTQAVCPNNLVINGDLSDGTPSSQDQDINNAIGFSEIWSTGSLGDFYAANQSPSGYSPPSPQTGNYVSCWISNNNISSTSFREGFKAELFNTITAGSGYYNISFDMACLNGWGNSELAVYGVTNPNGVSSLIPTSSHVPTNPNLFGTSNTVLLGTVTLGGNCSNNKTTQSFLFNSNAGTFPINGITHIFITHSDNVITGGHYVAFDNFCLSPIISCPELLGTRINCLEDANFDGVPEYSIRMFIENPGVVNVSANCGTVSPASITVTNPGWYNIVVTSQWQSCATIGLTTTHFDIQGNQCHEATTTFPVPRCPIFGGERLVESESFAVSPNPASNELHLKWETKEVPKKLSLSIVSTNGREMQRIDNINGHEGYQKIDIKKLEEGIYIIKIAGENYTPSPIKFIKKN